MHGCCFILEYRDDMLVMLEDWLIAGTKCKVARSDAPSLASTGEQVPRQEVIARQQTRGLAPKEHHIPAGNVEQEGARRKRKK